MQPRITLTQFIIEEQRRIPDATGDFTSLLNDLVTACKHIHRVVNQGGLGEALGTAGSSNTHGEQQKQLDLIANDALITALEWTGHLAAMASEEMTDIYTIPARYPRGKYLLVFDPLDGSSNIDVNVSVGTIFSILRNPDGAGQRNASHFCQSGSQQVCAGYVIYGPATMLVFTTGSGVNGFTLDPAVGDFFLTHPGLRIPRSTGEFAINASNQRHWEAPVQRYVDDCLRGEHGERGKNYNMRWIASLVAEVHRILIRGGVFLYPRDARYPDGRLRLLYEANPVSFLVEQADGRSTTGTHRVMDLAVQEIHQRCPLMFGSAEEVERLEQYHGEAARRLA